jgi:hypothetical protein
MKKQKSPPVPGESEGNNFPLSLSSLSVGFRGYFSIFKKNMDRIRGTDCPVPFELLKII